MPQPVTAFSSNHYSEHLKQIETALKVFGENKAKDWPAIPIIVYDLGMDNYQISYVKDHKMLEYRKIDYEKYPDFVQLLTTYSWKTIIWAEMLQDFPAILWFDTSMNFIVKDRVHMSKIVKKYVIGRQSSFLYFQHPAGHSISWATAADMFGYLPSDLRIWIFSFIFLFICIYF